MIKEVAELIEYCDSVNYRLLKHKDDNGNDSACCLTADMILKHSILATSLERKSIVDVLRYLEFNFSWGIDHCEYICQCLDHKDTIDCISMTHLSLHALDMALEVCEDRFEVTIVDVVVRASIEDSKHWKKKANDEWMRDGYLYHQCVGLINKDSKTLTLHDPSQEGDIYCYQNFNLDFESAILAIKVKPKSMISCLWDGKLELKYNEWQILSTECAPKNTSSDLTIFISGVASSSTNPCAGIGVARSLRSHPLLDNSNLIAVDKSYFHSGALDPAFTSCITIDYFGAADSIQDQFEAIINLLVTHKNSCYIPCRDFDISTAALGKHLLLNGKNSSDSSRKLNIDFIKDQSDENLQMLASKFLCPNYHILDKIEKPDFKILAKIEFPFIVPTCLSIGTLTSLFDIKHFAETIGYPLVVKGKTQGCVCCHSFFDIIKVIDQPWCKDGFIQRHITGTERGLAFASVNGEITGAMIMTKTAYTPEGKVWMGMCYNLTQAIP